MECDVCSRRDQQPKRTTNEQINKQTNKQYIKSKKKGEDKRYSYLALIVVEQASHVLFKLRTGALGLFLVVTLLTSSLKSLPDVLGSALDVRSQLLFVEGVELLLHKIPVLLQGANARLQIGSITINVGDALTNVLANGLNNSTWWCDGVCVCVCVCGVCVWGGGGGGGGGGGRPPPERVEECTQCHKLMLRGHTRLVRQHGQGHLLSG
jgi:hypothetical protein